MNQALIVLIVCVISGSVASARDQGTQRDGSAPGRSKLYKLEELTWPQIDALDRERTVFILPVLFLVELLAPKLVFCLPLLLLPPRPLLFLPCSLP